MAKMVDAVQPHCDEPIIAAMTCSHAGSMGATLFSKFLDGAGEGFRSNALPNPVFIAVGKNTIYAFKYKPSWFKFKIKKEVARWPIDQVVVTSEETGRMCYFLLSMKSGEEYALEIPIMMGGKELVHMFLDAMGE
ncbi:MAG: hypothetical protein KAR44_13780 [Candidatus Aegiribacteria sp.]|nr:hypothetical protein [Candidatus Aegiribacteria sp.]